MTGDFLILPASPDPKKLHPANLLEINLLLMRIIIIIIITLQVVIKWVRQNVSLPFSSSN